MVNSKAYKEGWCVAPFHTGPISAIRDLTQGRLYGDELVEWRGKNEVPINIEGLEKALMLLQ